MPIRLDRWVWAKMILSQHIAAPERRAGRGAGFQICLMISFTKKKTIIINTTMMQTNPEQITKETFMSRRRDRTRPSCISVSQTMWKIEVTPV